MLAYTMYHPSKQQTLDWPCCFVLRGSEDGAWASASLEADAAAQDRRLVVAGLSVYDYDLDQQICDETVQNQSGGRH